MAGYAHYELSLFDSAYSPRYYMGLMFALPFDTWNHDRLNHAKDGLRAAAVQLTSKIPALTGDIMLDPKKPCSGCLVLGIPFGGGQHVSDSTLASNSILRVLEHGSEMLSYSNLEQQAFHPSCMDPALFSPFPNIPDSTMAHAVCGIQANVVRGGLVVVFCLHHGFADGLFARHAVNAFIGALSKQPWMLPDGFVYSLPELEGGLEVGDTRELLKQCPERFIKPTAPIDIPPPNRERSHTLSAVPKPIPTDDAAIANLRLSGPLLAHLKATVLVTLSRMAKESETPPTPELKAIASTISTNDAAAAFVWAHLAAARSAYHEDESEADKTYRVFMPVDARRRIKYASLIPLNYMGNAILTVSASLPLSLLLAAREGLRTNEGAQALAKVALAIRTAVVGVNDAYIRTRLTLAKSVLAEYGDIRKLGLGIDLEGGRDIVFNNLAFVNAGQVAWKLGEVTVKPAAVRRMLPGAKEAVCTIFTAGEAPMPAPKAIRAPGDEAETQTKAKAETGTDSAGTEQKGRKVQEAWEIEVVLADQATQALEGMKSWTDAVGPA